MALNIIDVAGNIITENITEDEALALVENNSADNEYAYFYYPINVDVLEALKEKYTTEHNKLAFIKRVVEE